MNLMDSNSELSISEQITLIKMLESDDIESVRLALSIINNYPKPAIGINHQCNLTLGKYPIIMNYSFFQCVRRAAIFELSLPLDNLIDENREMLERLARY